MGSFIIPPEFVRPRGSRYRSFVLNVALSRSGRGVIDAEVSALKRLGDLSVPPFIPKVYGKGSVGIGAGLTADMFLGEWFEGYHEFHLSRGPLNGAQTLCVWGKNDIPYYLTSEEACLLYLPGGKDFNPLFQYGHYGANFPTGIMQGGILSSNANRIN